MAHFFLLTPPLHRSTPSFWKYAYLRLGFRTAHRSKLPRATWFYKSILWGIASQLAMKDLLTELNDLHENRAISLLT